MDAVAHPYDTDGLHGSAHRGGRRRLGRLEAKSIANRNGMCGFDNEIGALVALDIPDQQSAIVRLRTRDVLAAIATTVHAPGVSAAEYLHQRFNLFDRRRKPTLAAREGVEPSAIRFRNGGDVLRLLLATFDLEAADPELRELLEMIVCREILRRNEIAAVERVTGRCIGKGIVLPTRLRARSAVGRAFTDHAGHETLSGVRDAQRPVYECFETELRYRLADRANVLEGVLARQNHALDAEALHDARAARVVDGHLRRTVHLQLRIHLLDEPHDAQILYDRRIYSTVDTLAQVGERFC